MVPPAVHRFTGPPPTAEATGSPAVPTGVHVGPAHDEPVEIWKVPGLSWWKSTAWADPPGKSTAPPPAAVTIVSPPSTSVMATMTWPPCMEVPSLVCVRVVPP